MRTSLSANRSVAPASAVGPDREPVRQSKSASLKRIQALPRVAGAALSSRSTFEAAFTRSRDSRRVRHSFARSVKAEITRAKADVRLFDATRKVWSTTDRV